LTDSANQTIRTITSAGVVSTLAGYAGTTGKTNVTTSAARFNYPNAVATDGAYVFVADSLNHQIRKVVISTGGCFIN